MNKLVKEKLTHYKRTHRTPWALAKGDFPTPILDPK